MQYFFLTCASQITYRAGRFTSPEDVPVQYSGLIQHDNVHGGPPKLASEFTAKGGEKVNRLMALRFIYFAPLLFQSMFFIFTFNVGGHSLFLKNLYFYSCSCFEFLCFLCLNLNKITNFCIILLKSDRVMEGERIFTLSGSWMRRMHDMFSQLEALLRRMNGYELFTSTLLKPT